MSCRRLLPPLLLLAGCGGGEALELRAVEPGAVMAGAPAPARLVGAGFHDVVKLAVDTHRPPVVLGWRVTVGGIEVAEADIGRRTGGALELTLPALVRGWHDVAVTSPRGSTVTLLRAVEAVTPVSSPDLATTDLATVDLATVDLLAPLDGGTPPDQATAPPDQATAPPDQATAPPDQATAPPDQKGGDQLVCETSCATTNCQNCCREQCGGAQCNQVCSGCACALDCQATGSCVFKCDSAASCTARSTGAKVANLSCIGGSSCSLDCAGTDSCHMACNQSSRCMLQCSTSLDCKITGCTPITCPNNVQVCNQPCP